MNKLQFKNDMAFKRKIVVTAVAMAITSSALAFEFDTDGGWQGSLNTTLTASSSWRAQAPDKRLIGAADAYWAKNVAAGQVLPIKGAALTGQALGAITLAETAAMAAAGYHGGAHADTANLNYDKGDRFSTLAKFVTELRLSKGDTGMLMRVKGWYDQALNDESVPFGNRGNGYNNSTFTGTGYVKGAPSHLNDQGFAPLNRFDGLYLLDAYAWTSFDIGNLPLQIRAGRQAINWGESIFIQGINQISPLDVTALRQAGTEIKEAILPVWSLYGNLGLPGGMSLEGFDQLKWEATNVDGCGSYWGITDFSYGTSKSCAMTQPVATSSAPEAVALANASAALQTAIGGNPSFMLEDYRKPKDSGQWGLAFRFPVEAIDTEVGLYAVNIHARVGNISPVLRDPKIGGAGTAPGLRAFGNWEFPEDLRIYGLTASTTLSGWSVGAELSYAPEVPVQRNGNDVILAALTLLSKPAAFGGMTVAQAASLTDAQAASSPQFNALRNGARGAVATAGPVAQNLLGFIQANPTGGLWHGYDMFHKTQFQINGVNTLGKSITDPLGATTGLFVAEAGFQWNNVPENNLTNIRYGRAFIFGNGQASSIQGRTATGAAAALGSSVCPAVGGAFGFNDSGCENSGFVTDFAWGYKMRASLDYSQAFGTSWTMSPSLFWAHDVKGWSMDGQFNEGRKTLAFGLGFNLNKIHNISLNYTTYADSAKYDPFRDHDNYSVAYSYTF